MSLTPEQRELRRLGIGSSDIAALTGHSTWRTPWDVWRAKVEGVEREGESFQQELGSLIEPVVLELYRRRTGAELSTPGTLRHPSLPFVLTTPDAVAEVDFEVRAVEAKTCLPWQAEKFGAEGTDEVPPAYLLQALWHLITLRAVHGSHIEACDVPVLFGTQEFRIYRVRWDAEVAAGLVKVAGDFWAAHVETKTPPPVDGSYAASAWLSEQFPANREPLRDAADAEHALAEMLRAAKEAEKAAKAARADAENRLKAAIGDSEGVKGNGFRVSWRADKAGKRRFLAKFDNEEAESNG